MRSLSHVVCALAVIVVAADQAAAQDRGAFGEPTGVRESARLLDEADITRAAFAPGVKPVWLFLPGYLSAEGLRLPGGAFGLVVKSKIPVQFRVGYKRQDFTEIADRNRRALGPGRHDDAAKVLEPGHQGLAPDERLLAGPFEVGTTSVGVVALERLEDVAEREVEGSQPSRVELDLVGLELATEAVDLDDPRHGAQRRAETRP